MRRLLPLFSISSIFSIFYILVLLFFPTQAQAADYQQCETSSTCTIGEFLYDDDYAPLPGQTCTLTAKNPDGTAFITNGAMSSRGDGWYSYDASISTTTGLYTATICCTPPGGTMCLDKSFEVKGSVTTGATAAEVWSYSNRTMTSYGNLISDIWSYSSRSLTSFGSVVSDVWNYSGRTLTSFGSLVESILGVSPESIAAGDTPPSTLQNIVAEQTEQRELLEKLVNAPVVSLSLDESGNIPDLELKLDESRKQASLLYDTISSAKSRLMSLDTKWDRLSKDAAEAEITTIASSIQSQESLATLEKLWDHPTVSSLSENLVSLKSSLSVLLSATTISKTALAPQSLMASLSTLSSLEDTLGDTTNSSADQTFYGHLAAVDERNATLLAEKQKIAAVLENLNGQGTNNAEREVKNIKSRLLTLNQYPGGEDLATPAKIGSDEKLNLKNILFSLQALVHLNTQILAMNVGDPIRSLWLEEGSIIFRAVITNPSSVISQSVPLKFYLPREVKTEDIMALDPSLTSTYDPTEEALYVSGTYELKPKATKVVYVEIQDIWQLSDTELQTLRTQASDLLKPLTGTTYYSQGTVLKSDIDITLDKIALSTSRAITPENRIRTYREAKLELSKVNTNMSRLQDLVAQSGGTSSVFGFVGGVQTTAVWGIILVVIAGFIFLSLYFKKIGLTYSQSVAPVLAVAPEKDLPPEFAAVLPSDKSVHLTPLASHYPEPAPAWKMPVVIAIVVVVTAGSTIFLTQLAKPKTPPIINQVETSPSPTPSPTVKERGSSPMPSVDSIDVKSEKSVLGETAKIMSLLVPPDSSINVRNKPSADADIVMTIKESLEVYVFQVSGDWSQIGFKETDSAKGYWVASKFLTQK